MKILLSTPYNREIFEKFPGGISVWARNLANHHLSDSRDIELDIFSTTRNKDINERTSKLKRIFEGIKDYGTFLIKTYRKLKKENFDAIQFTSTGSMGLCKDIATIMIAKMCHTKSIIHFHFGRIPELSRIKTLEWKLLRYAVKKSDISIVIDPNSYKVLINEGFDNIRYLPNPLSKEIMNIIEETSNIKRQPRSILFAARVFRQKGIYELVEACCKVPNIKLKVVGNVETEVKNELKAITGNADWIQFTGPIPHNQVIIELLSCDIYILPTYNEGFPNAILECMACGTPTITTSVGAIPEMMNFEGEPCGYEVRKQNVEDLVNAINKLLVDEELKLRYSELSKKRVSEMYSEDIVYDIQYKIWKECEK